MALAAGGAGAQEAITVFAAGSLRAPITQAVQVFEQAHPGTRIALVFGASGLLRDCIVAGEKADVQHGKGYGRRYPWRATRCARSRGPGFRSRARRWCARCSIRPSSRHLDAQGRSLGSGPPPRKTVTD